MSHDKSITHSTLIHDRRRRRNSGATNPTAPKLQLEVSNNVHSRLCQTCEFGPTIGLLPCPVPRFVSSGPSSVPIYERKNHSDGKQHELDLSPARDKDAGIGWCPNWSRYYEQQTISPEQSSGLGLDFREAQSSERGRGDRRWSIRDHLGLLQDEEQAGEVLDQLAIPFPPEHIQDALISALISWTGSPDCQLTLAEARELAEHLFCCLNSEGWPLDELSSGQVFGFQLSDALDLADSAVRAIFQKDDPSNACYGCGQA